MNTNITTIDNYSFITLTNDKGFSVTLCDLGASIYSIIFNKKEMTFVPEDYSVFFKGNIYYGKTIGRISNRVKGNKVTIDGKDYLLENNEGENTLHGGLYGLSTKKFDYQIKENEEETTITFTYLMKDLEDGLPGNTLIKITYTISENKDELNIDFSAKTDSKTILSLTNHAYFNLGEKDLSPLSLRINAKEYLEVNPANLLAIQKRPCLACLNFQTFKKILRDIDDGYLVNSRTKGYDHYFYFEKVDSAISQLSLKSDSIQMDAITDYPGVQIYSDNYKDAKGRNTNKETRRAIAIEPSASHLDLHYLESDQEYHHFIKYIFKAL